MTNESELHKHRLKGGAQMWTPLREDELYLLKDTPKFSLKSNSERGFQLGKFAIWMPEGSRFTTYERHMEVTSRIKKLAEERTGLSKPLVIFDWGTANGLFLTELNEKLDEWGIKNTILLGSSHQYFEKWEGLPKNSIMLFALREHYANYLKDLGLKIDLVVSHYALFECALSQGKKHLFSHLHELHPLLKENAEILSTGRMIREGEDETSIKESIFNSGFSLEILESSTYQTHFRSFTKRSAGPQKFKYHCFTRLSK